MEGTRKKEEEQCCGGCKWFAYEDTFGIGLCLHIPLRHDNVRYCGEGSQCADYEAAIDNG